MKQTMSEINSKRVFYYPLLVVMVSMIFISCNAQNSIKGNIQDAKGIQVKLFAYYEDGMNLIDSTQINNKGSFHFDATHLHRGMYRLSLGRNGFFDVFYEGKAFTVQSDIRDLNASLRFKGSPQNTLYYEFLDFQNKTFERLELLTHLLKEYSDKEPFYAHLSDEFSKLQFDYQNFCEGAMKNYKDDVVAKVIASNRRPFLKHSMTLEDQRSYLQGHMLDFVDFEDTVLLYTNVIPQKILDYLALFQDKRYSKADMEKAYVRAVDQILNGAMFNDRMYTFVLDYLITGFERFNFDQVVTYIADNFDLMDACENAERKTELEKKLNAYKKLAIGNEAPEIAMKQINGQDFKLSTLDAKYTLVMFWAAWCPHCKMMLPDLQYLYPEYSKKGLEVVSISLDKDPAFYKQEMQGINLPWVQLGEFSGWDTQAADDYYIFATPTFFLLDKDKKIIAKPDKVADIAAFL